MKFTHARNHWISVEDNRRIVGRCNCCLEPIHTGDLFRDNFLEGWLCRDCAEATFDEEVFEVA